MQTYIGATISNKAQITATVIKTSTNKCYSKQVLKSTMKNNAQVLL